MTSPDQARATQLRNIETKTGQTLAGLCAAIAASGKAKHGEVRAWLMETYSLGYGDANGLAHFAAERADQSTGTGALEDDRLAAIYGGKKAHLRSVHDAVLAAIRPFGDFEIAVKKSYVSLRRKKQFATLGPKNASQAELGINLKDDISSDRIVAQKPGGMCQYAVSLTGPEDVDTELCSALRRAFDAAG